DCQDSVNGRSGEGKSLANARFPGQEGRTPHQVSAARAEAQRDPAASFSPLPAGERGERRRRVSLSLRPGRGDLVGRSAFLARKPCVRQRFSLPAASVDTILTI